MAQKLVDINQQQNVFYASMDSPIGKLVLESDGDAILSIHIESFGEPKHDFRQIQPDSFCLHVLHPVKSNWKNIFKAPGNSLIFPFPQRELPFKKRSGPNYNVYLLAKRSVTLNWPGGWVTRK